MAGPGPSGKGAVATAAATKKKGKGKGGKPGMLYKRLNSPNTTTAILHESIDPMRIAHRLMGQRQHPSKDGRAGTVKASACGATIRELCPEDKARVRHLIDQVTRLDSERKASVSAQERFQRDLLAARGELESVREQHAELHHHATEVKGRLKQALGLLRQYQAKLKRLTTTTGTTTKTKTHGKHHGEGATEQERRLQQLEADMADLRNTTMDALSAVRSLPTSPVRPHTQHKASPLPSPPQHHHHQHHQHQQRETVAVPDVVPAAIGTGVLTKSQIETIGDPRIRRRIFVQQALLLQLLREQHGTRDGNGGGGGGDGGSRPLTPRDPVRRPDGSSNNTSFFVLDSDRDGDDDSQGYDERAGEPDEQRRRADLQRRIDRVFAPAARAAPTQLSRPSEYEDDEDDLQDILGSSVAATSFYDTSLVDVLEALDDL